MTETLAGIGTLRQESPPAQWAVSYRFDIATEIVKKAGFPLIAARSHSSGTVESLNGKSIPQGTYQLEVNDGEILRVKNLGMTWSILAPL